jgi:hypothetical protein
MLARTLILILGLCACAAARAWGPEGHSIVAEIAQRRLSPAAAARVEELLGKGHSLASEASWADDIRDERPETSHWHFVDIPISAKAYDPRRDCRPNPRGDCVVAELDRLENELRCAPTEALRRDALRFAVHFVADVHQPLHTVGDERGGNEIRVEVRIDPLRCERACRPTHFRTNFHALWDETLITNTTWSWGAYVRRLENGWLRSTAARDSAAAGGTPEQWANESHAVAREVWSWLPADRVIDDDYYRKVLPLLDQQLGLAGLRLARFLNEAYASSACPRN